MAMSSELGTVALNARNRTFDPTDFMRDTTASRQAPRVSFKMCTSSMRKSLTNCINLAWSFHFLVMLSHFSGVVMMMLAFWTMRSWPLSVSPVSSAHCRSSEANFPCQSLCLSAHKDFVGAM